MVLGGPHPDEKVRAGELRRIEADAVALAIAQINDEPLRWMVSDKTASTPDETVWRKPQLRDITILLPTRTSLPFLQRALNDYGVPFRADTGTLLFDQPEIRAMRAALMAVADPGDELAVVAALRSSLWPVVTTNCWRGATPEVGGTTQPRAPPPWRPTTTLPLAWPSYRRGTPIGGGSNRVRSFNASLEIGKHLRRRTSIGAPRDSWRRLRYLTEQARAFQESGGGDLRAFLDWVDLQGQDGARAHEPTLDEEDDDAFGL